MKRNKTVVGLLSILLAGVALAYFKFAGEVKQKVAVVKPEVKKVTKKVLGRTKKKLRKKTRQ